MNLTSSKLMQFHVYSFVWVFVYIVLLVGVPLLDVPSWYSLMNHWRVFSPGRVVTLVSYNPLRPRFLGHTHTMDTCSETPAVYLLTSELWHGAYMFAFFVCCLVVCMKKVLALATSNCKETSSVRKDGVMSCNLYFSLRSSKAVPGLAHACILWLFVKFPCVAFVDVGIKRWMLMIHDL